MKQNCKSLSIIFHETFFLDFLEVHCQDLPETWSYPESTANGWDGLCTTGLKQSPIELYSDDLPTPNIHSNINFKNYFSANSRNTYGYFKVLLHIINSFIKHMIDLSSYNISN